MTSHRLGPAASLIAHIKQHPLFSSAQYKAAFSGASKTPWMLAMGTAFSPKTLPLL